MNFWKTTKIAFFILVIGVVYSTIFFKYYENVSNHYKIESSKQQTTGNVYKAEIREPQRVKGSYKFFIYYTYLASGNSESGKNKIYKYFGKQEVSNFFELKKFENSVIKVEYSSNKPEISRIEKSGLLFWNSCYFLLVICAPLIVLIISLLAYKKKKIYGIGFLNKKESIIIILTLISLLGLSLLKPLLERIEYYNQTENIDATVVHSEEAKIEKYKKILKIAYEYTFKGKTFKREIVLPSMIKFRKKYGKVGSVINIRILIDREEVSWLPEEEIGSFYLGYMNFWLFIILVFLLYLLFKKDRLIKEGYAKITSITKNTLNTIIEYEYQYNNLTEIRSFKILKFLHDEIFYPGQLIPVKYHPKNPFEKYFDRNKFLFEKFGISNAQ